MTVHRNFWVGTGAHEGEETESIWRVQRPDPGQGWDSVPVERSRQTPAPSYLTLHPAADRLYAVAEAESGMVTSLDIGFDSDCKLGHMRSVRTGGSGPCHLRVHPQGRWLYAANYGDGMLSAVELTEAGDVSENVRTYPYPKPGSGAVPDRQESAHAHATRISPGGGFLLVSDLGTDEIRSYPLSDGVPIDEPVITALPAGTGPRHFAGTGSYLYLAGELSETVLVLVWDESSGTAELIDEVPAATLPGRSAPGHQLSHIMYTRGRVLVASRGSDSISTFATHDDGARLELIGEAQTGAWPRHMALVGSHLVVAAERDDAVVIHPFTPDGDPDGGYAGAVGPELHRLEIPTPMFILPM